MKWYYLLAFVMFCGLLALAYWAVLEWESFIAFWTAVNETFFK